MELPIFANSPQSPLSARPGYIRAACVELDNPGFDNEWPTHFVVRPMEGDLVKSQSGKIAKISNVVHLMGAGEPILLLELTRNISGVTPMEGGGGALE